VVFYNGSHLQNLNAIPAANGLLEIPPSHLASENIRSTEVEMARGGM